MYVGRIMHTRLVTVPPDTSLRKAKEIIEEKKINHLLVVNKNEDLVGLVSDRDVKQSWASPATALSVHELNYLLTQLTVEAIMVKKIITISPGTTIERAAYIMQKNRINALPVIESGKLVGIITSTDVMEVLLRSIGFDDEESARFAVLVEDRIGIVFEVSKILKEQQINIRSLVTWPEKEYPGVFQLVMRVGLENKDRAISALSDGGFKVLSEYVHDLTPYMPKG
ncbi:MAG: CBS and ACT domain-containing protein [Desulfobacteraceae bacterium]|jgi:acetoin utilization protein AcuB|nr:CBS and ACT domain-containing protein [Desulfobacteraceae bacterium]MDH3572307.1 CBS and ACT domain-containing protein [Desulfobacteraceae bacterium]MDH3720295.1 CBS and ACT domain-containing protein [Desulfobacteraceae bacterium]MDH3835437.1 CBS and ACT domain-containing protein [Desulfobacteraceae bacterium]MDH3873225.1 CBS and ACT domain-containing protein [Desulfobacteraceae bacterium]